MSQSQQTVRSLSVETWRTHPVYHVSIPDDDPARKQATSEAEEMGSLHNSIEDGDGNFAGLLAEFVFADVFDAERAPTYEYDVVRNGVSCDLKTKRRTVAPKAHYEASIADYNTEQGADVYYFASYDTESDVLTLLGYLPTGVYYELATFHEKGERDPSNGFEFTADCYNVEYSDLWQVGLGDRA